MTGISFGRWLSITAVALVVGCIRDLGEPLQSGKVLALRGVQGRWVGPVRPEDPTCGPATQGLMSVGAKGFGFDPFQSTTVIQGTIEPDGQLRGKLIRQTGQQAGAAIVFEATPTPSDAEPPEIIGTLQSGRCRWKVTLHRG